MNFRQRAREHQPDDRPILKTAGYEFDARPYCRVGHERDDAAAYGTLKSVGEDFAGSVGHGVRLLSGLMATAGKS